MALQLYMIVVMRTSSTCTLQACIGSWLDVSNAPPTILYVRRATAARRRAAGRSVLGLLVGLWSTLAVGVGAVSLDSGAGRLGRLDGIRHYQER